MRQSWGSNVIDFVYDENNQPYAMRYRSTTNGVYNTYYYVLNVQGDVVGLLNSSGAIAAKYTYDPWGKVTVQNPSGTTNTSSSFIGNINPLRYRGYYYDTETGFYYLQTRYYDPAIGRFINADTYTTTDETGLLSTNMFAYCENNPVMGTDPTGEFLDTVFDVISLCSSVAEVIANPANPWAWAGLAGDVVDLIPGVTGVGETVRAVNTARKAAKKANDVVDVSKKTVKASERAKAVRQAWKNEAKNVAAGGTGVSRTWSKDEMKQLLKHGKVKGYHGHHMKSVKGYPELAGDPTNIQFLTRTEHLAAHGGNWRNITHGRYNYNT